MHAKLLLRALFRRTKTFRRGRARPVLRAQGENPHCGPRPGGVPPSPGKPGRASRPPLGSVPQTRSCRRDATVAHMAVLHDATLRHDDTREGQLGDISFHSEAVDVGIFGLKTDQLLEGPSAQMPRPRRHAPPVASGARALLEVPRRGLARLAALPATGFAAVARRLAERFPRAASTPGAMAALPDDVRALAVPLYERGLLVYCLQKRLLAVGAPHGRVQPLSHPAHGALRRAGTGSACRSRHAHRRRRRLQPKPRRCGRAHPRGHHHGKLSRALRHLSKRSIIPYVFHSVHTGTSVLAGAMRAAARRSRGCGLRRRCRRTTLPADDSTSVAAPPAAGADGRSRASCPAPCGAAPL